MISCTVVGIDGKGSFRCLLCNLAPNFYVKSYGGVNLEIMSLLKAPWGECLWDFVKGENLSSFFKFWEMKMWNLWFLSIPLPLQCLFPNK